MSLASPGFPVPLAGWVVRTAALLIDLAPMFLLAAASRSWASAVLAAGYFVLLGHLEGMTGQTPGKAVMGIELVDEQGRMVGPKAGVGRKLLHVLDLIPLGLGFLMPIVHVRRQTLADRMVSTYVVGGRRPRPLSLALWIPPKSD